MNYFNKATIDDKPLPAEEDAATFFTTQESSNGYGLYKNSAKDQEFKGFSSATTNEEFNDQDIPAKFSTDVRYNQGGSYANTRDEDEIYKSYDDTKDSSKDEYKPDAAGYFADLNQQKGNGYESYDEVMKRFNEMQQYRNEEAKFQEGYEP
ncbi:hypothetical protein MRB53_015524 [Persea americana]|uniref:Uncharacterized protein n=1 Tax=Persea americana TaxID=3435 RepID=A0ACC2LZK9_PERAE|nr:hypothetical protein MRB53_015524 [Persea americana]